MNGKIFARILAALVLIGVIAGIALLAFNAGIAQGVATRLPASAPQSGTGPYPYYGAPFFWHPFFGVFGFLIALFLLFFALRLISFLFWGPRAGWGGHMARHAWRHGWYEGDLPPMFKEMHDRAHGKQPEENKQ
ncbi:MAG TPA: hypothetical protein VLZ89_15690 [Anaerolineales bacterium]|nr:hypothetical protein [Anaerolineales bacterium]